MYSPNLIVYTVAILCFIFSFAGFYVLSQRNEEFAPRKNTPFLIFLPVIIISFFASYSLLPDKSDFIYSFSLRQLIVTIGGSGVIYFSFRFLDSKILKAFICSVCSIIACWFIPTEFILIPQLSPIVGKAILCLCLFAFSYFYPLSNNIDTLTCIQTLGINIGIFVLALIGGTPVLFGSFALSLAAICLAFLAFNRYPAQLSFIPAGCNALGFITGCQMIWSSIEGSSIAILIFSMFFLVELLSAIIRKMLDWQNSFALNTYTGCYQANLSGFPPYTIAGHILRLQIVLLLMGCFAIYAPIGVAVPVFSFIITVWYISKIKNWQIGNKTIRELNNDLMNNIKNNISNIKEQINKDK